MNNTLSHLRKEYDREFKINIDGDTVCLSINKEGDQSITYSSLRAYLDLLELLKRNEEELDKDKS